MTRLFALGTLKRGFPLRDDALAGARYLGACRTAQRYPMLVAGPWFAPMMLDQPGRGLHVKGELYEIDVPRLARIDAIESVGQPGNFRIELELEALEEGTRCSAFAYVKSPELAIPVHSEFLDDYQDRRFIPPWERA